MKSKKLVLFLLVAVVLLMMTGCQSKESAKKEAAPVKDKEPEAKKAPKAEVKAGPEEEINIEYGGCSYSKDDLVNRALKIWTSKLKRGRSELHNMELYVKPQENTVYYVFNGKRKGSFEL